MAYTPQYYPGSSHVAVNRRKHMSGDVEKLRTVSDDDLVAALGHRAPGADYPSTHPPLAEMGEPDCPVRQMVEPTPGAAAGDRVRYSTLEALTREHCQAGKSWKHESVTWKHSARQQSSQR